ncbi:MAG: GGDEF domain-containing protein [Candidatus Aureabacteria bacterium]|nr:GGDEF domain-containing protein [Candidatus Auribacterota bacterium]
MEPLNKNYSLFSTGIIISVLTCLISIFYPTPVTAGMLFLFFIIGFFALRAHKRQVQLLLNDDKKRIIDLEMQCYTSESFLGKLVSSGNNLIAEMERDALLKQIREGFATFTKASGGYLLIYNQNQDRFDWGIGLTLSNLKLKKLPVPSSDVLLGKILSNPTPVLFHDLAPLVSSNLFHVRDDILPSFVPYPEILITIKMQMKSSLFGIQFLMVTRTQASDIEKNLGIFNALVNQATLAIGSAVQREFAINDRMTMMYNHEYFVSRLRDEIASCERSKGRSLTLLMMDIDHFKKFNDTYGHQIGDLVLIESAKIYKKCVRMSDIVSRYGGEEFAIILPETNLQEGALVAEKIRSTIESSPFKTNKGDLKVTVSVGVCEWTMCQPPITVETMVKRADEKLYECKEKGRNRVCS